MRDGQGLVDLSTPEAQQVRANPARFYGAPPEEGGGVLDTKTFDRVKYTKNKRDALFDSKADPATGTVRDAVTGRDIKPGDKWEVGHVPTKEYWKARLYGIMDWLWNRNFPGREGFRDEQNKVEDLRPELPSSNRSGKGEDKTGRYKPPDSEGPDEQQ